MGVAGRYAMRSVGRNLRRTALSVLGIGIGCALALVMESLNRGRDELFVRTGAFSGSGHVRIVPAEWKTRRDVRLRLADTQAALAAAHAIPGVEVAVMRVRAQALLAMGTRVAPVEMVGVDAAVEPRAYRFVRTVHEGRYLRPEEQGAVVLGKTIANRLRAGLDDDVLATAVGRGGRIESHMLRIVGIVDTGSEEIDQTICHVAPAEVEALTGLPGRGEVTLILRDWRTTDAVRAALASRVAAGDEVLTWSEINPNFKGHLEQDKAMSRVVSAIILLIVFLGVTSAQLAAVLERRREFAMLGALGVSGARMVRLVLGEALVLGGAGAAAGLTLGAPLVWWMTAYGLDFSRFTSSVYTFQGVVMEPVIYGDLGPWVVAYVVTVAVGATLAASLYPAWFAARTDPAAALRVAQ